MRRLFPLFFSLALALPFPAYGFVINADTTGLQATGEAAGISENLSAERMAGLILKSLLGLLGIVVFGFVLYAGWLWITANGDSKQIQTANKILVNVAGGTLILLASGTLASYVITKLTNAANGQP